MNNPYLIKWLDGNVEYTYVLSIGKDVWWPGGFINLCYWQIVINISQCIWCFTRSSITPLQTI